MELEEVKTKKFLLTSTIFIQKTFSIFFNLTTKGTPLNTEKTLPKLNANTIEEEKTTSKQLQNQPKSQTQQVQSESESNAEKINKITSQKTNLNSEIEYGIAKDDEANDEQEQDFLNDEEFHDAVEDVTQFSVTLPRQQSLHQRNPSNISKMYLQESDIDSEDEEQQTIKVKRLKCYY